jgi:hypothetical protein
VGQIFFASLRLGVFALKSGCLIEWIRLYAEGNSWQLPWHGLFSVGIMIALVEQKKDDMADLCRRFKVERLELFGSAATGSFQATTKMPRLRRWNNCTPTSAIKGSPSNSADVGRRSGQWN